MVTSGTQGTVSKVNLIVGRWSSMQLITQGLNGTRYDVGATDEVALEIGREVYKHISNHNQQRVDAIIPIRAWMSAKGSLEEHHQANWNALMNKALGSAALYNYPGGQNECDVTAKVRMCRTRSCDGFVIEAYIHAAIQEETVLFGGGNEAVKVGFMFEALDDSLGQYGGSEASPYGFVYIPPAP
jgi:hypothetical protein